MSAPNAKPDPKPGDKAPVKSNDPLTEKLADLMIGNLAANNANPEAFDADAFERSKGAPPAGAAPKG